MMTRPQLTDQEIYFVMSSLELVLEGYLKLVQRKAVSSTNLGRMTLTQIEPTISLEVEGFIKGATAVTKKMFILASDRELKTAIEEFLADLEQHKFFSVKG